MSKVRLAYNTVTKVEWNTAARPTDGTQGVLAGLLMVGGEGCCSDGMQMEFQPQDESRLVTGNLFNDDGESAQAKRDEELEARRQQKIKEAEARKAERQAKTNVFFTGFVKKIKTMSEKFEEGIGDFLSDEEKDNNK